MRRSLGSKVRGERKREEVCGGLLCLELGDPWRGVGRKSCGEEEPREPEEHEEPSTPPASPAAAAAL